ncbi:MAG: hypothetical protein OXF01_16730 [Gemmatimonadetes bacterium]|nr:hypothetical protein [Gemmatimonadota bacterium]
MYVRRAAPRGTGRATTESAHAPTEADRSAILGTVQALFDALAEGSEEILTERMWDPEVRVSGDLAMVWTSYETRRSAGSS